MNEKVTNLSPEVTARLRAAEQRQEHYSPDRRHIEQILGQQVLVMFVAPATEGKSFVRETLAQLNPDFQPVTGFTTRPREPRDGIDSRYDFIPHDDAHLTQLLDQIDRRELLQYIVHPATGYLYGSSPDGYGAPYNTLDTLSGAVENLRQLPFKETWTVGLVSQPEEWVERFNTRYQDASKERSKRIDEAVESLEWLSSQEPGTITWAENRLHQEAAISQSLIDTITQQRDTSDNLSSIARAMLERARSLQ